MRNLYFGIIGLLIGFIAGFFYANHYNRANAPSPSPTMTGQLPPGHPPDRSERERDHSVGATSR